MPYGTITNRGPERYTLQIVADPPIESLIMECVVPQMGFGTEAQADEFVQNVVDAIDAAGGLSVVSATKHYYVDSEITPT
jgi:hypothetical protein